MANEVILVEYQAKVDGLVKELNQIRTQLKLIEDQFGKVPPKPFEEPEKSAKSLKAQLKELKAQLANATDPKDIERLARAAGELADQIEDASDAAKVFASGSKFEEIGTAFGSVLGKLRNLDFGDALNQSKLLLSTTKSLTFKDAIQGIKDLGGTLFNIGKSLITNPLFLLGTAITLIIANFDKLKNAGGVVGAVFTGIGNIISGVVSGLEAIGNGIGIIDTKSAEQTKNLIVNFDKQLKAIQDFYDKKIAIDDAYGKDTIELEKEKNRKVIIEANKLLQELNKKNLWHYESTSEFNEATGKIERERRLVRGEGLIKDEKDKFDELTAIINKAQTDNEILDAKGNAKKIKSDEDLYKERIKKITDHYNQLIAIDNTLGKDTIKIDKEKNEAIIKEATSTYNKIKQSQKEKGHIITDNEKNTQKDLLSIITSSKNAIEILDAKALKTKLDGEEKSAKEKIKIEEEQKSKLQSLLTERAAAELAAGDPKLALQQLKDKYVEEILIYSNNEEILKELTAKYNRDKDAIRNKDAQDQIKIAEDQKNKLQSLLSERAAAELAAGDPTLALQQLEDKYKEEQKKYKDNEEILTELKKKYERDRTAIQSKEEENRKMVAQETVQTLTNLYNAYAQIQQNNFQTQIQNAGYERDAKIEALDSELKNKTISEKEYAKRKKQIEDAAREQERKIKKEAWEAQKQAAIITTIINTATAIVAQLQVPTVGFILAALAAASGAAQIAVIESQPEPKFEKGGMAKGKRHSQGGIKVEVEDSEWIIRRDEAMKHDKLLSAVNAGKAEDYIYKHYIVPAIKKQMKTNEENKSKSFADNLAASLSYNFKDENILDSLKASRKNDKEIAMYIVNELKGISNNPRRR